MESSLPDRIYISVFDETYQRLALPETRKFPPGENAIDNTASVWSSKGPKKRSPFSAFQMLIARSSEHVAIFDPSGEYVTQRIQSA